MAKPQDRPQADYPKAINTFTDDAGVKRAKYLLPSGETITIKVPNMTDLTVFEDVREEFPERGIRQVLKMLEHLGVSNLEELPANDFPTVAKILESFFG